MTHSSQSGPLPSGGAARSPFACPPDQVGLWQLGGLIGAGARAMVYFGRSHDAPADEFAYAVKVLKSQYRDDPLALRSLQREAQVGSQVSHPHVVAILDWGFEQGPPHVVMPALAGTPLSAMLSSGQPLDLTTALWIARQVAQGLGALHQAGWTHCDVKPENIFVGCDGHVTLLDLGFACPDSQPATLLDRPVVGTLHYMAPEMLTSALAADRRSDIYSLGVVLYQMLTGRQPYEGRNPAEIAELQRAGVPDRLRCLVPSLPMEIVSLVRRMLAKEPLRRPQDSEEVVGSLVRLELDSLAEQVAA